MHKEYHGDSTRLFYVYYCCTERRSCGFCEADATSVQAALAAHKAQTGAYPSADSWSTLTRPLTTTVNSVAETLGPWLKESPSTTNYVINFDGNGDVSVDKVGVEKYQSADDIDTGSGLHGACEANASR